MTTINSNGEERSVFGFLKATAFNKDLPIEVRLKAAIAAVGYEQPKLQAIAHFDGSNLGERLAKGRERVAKLRQNLIEGKVVGSVNGEEVVVLPPAEKVRRF